MTMIMLTNEEKMDIKRRYLEAQEKLIDKMLDGDVSAFIEMGNVIQEIIPAEIIYQIAKEATEEDIDKCEEIIDNWNDRIEDERKNDIE